MNLFTSLFSLPKRILSWFMKRSKVVKIIIIIVAAGGGYFGYKTLIQKSNSAPQYQTSTAQLGTLVVSVNSSGTVTSGNNTPATTSVSGVVKNVFVQNDQMVKAGDKIAEIDLDTASNQKYTQALASYQSAKNNLATANTNMLTLQSTLLTKWQTFMNTSQNSTYQNADGSPNTSNRNLPQFYTVNNDWLASEATYKNQQNVIAQAQSSLSSAWLSLQQASPTIYAPISGTVTGLSLRPGSVLDISTDSTVTGKKIANIQTAGKPQVSVNLTQIDVPKIKVGQKAVVTFDAFADKTFTGKVISIDTAGVTSSGVTTYPAKIELDVEANYIYPNMSATITIITNTKSDVVIVPNAAVIKQASGAIVRTLVNNTLKENPVEIGIASDAETEVVSGINAGDTIVTSITQSSSSRTPTTTSVFSPFGGNAFRGTAGGGAVRIQGR